MHLLKTDDEKKFADLTETFYYQLFILEVKIFLFLSDSQVLI